MPLLLDRTAELSGRSMAHALVIGISKYRYLPCEEAPGPFRELTQTSFCARSAMTFARWLVENRDQIAVPLATCQVLLAPSDKELESDSTLRENVEECSVANFIAAASRWRASALENPEGAMVLYFSGHAIELATEQPTLLLEDFGDGIGPRLRASINVANLLEGLAPAEWQPHISRQQFMFFDTDRIVHHGISAESLWRTTEVFDIPRRSHFDDRKLCALYATSAGKRAFAYEDDRTFFNVALMNCLDHSAYEAALPDLSPVSSWRITTRSLVRAMQAELNALSQTQQPIFSNIRGDDAVLVERVGAPNSLLQLSIEPAELRPHCHVKIWNAESKLVADISPQENARPETPIEVVDIPAGLYRIEISAGGKEKGTKLWQSLVQVVPSRMSMVAKIDA